MFRFLALLLYPVARAFRPPAPGRFGELTQLFREAFPEADADRWEEHCLELARAAYWEGEARGYDRARGLDEEALERRHDWSATRDRPSLGQRLAGLRPPDDPLRGASPEQLKTVRDAIRDGWEVEVRLDPDDG